MKNLGRLFEENLCRISLPILPIVFFGFQSLFCSGLAQVSGVSDSPQERELYNTLPDGNEQGTILDITNPIELMNRLRRATAMDDATSPSDAIDAAIKALEGEKLPTSSLEVKER